MKKPKQNYLEICSNITETALRSGRKPEDINLIAVTKGHSLEDILPVYEAGCRSFGENRLSEALPKIEQTPSDIEWHLIGTLQKNKVKKALEHFLLIHSVDTPDLALEISKVAQKLNKQAAVLLQVNTSKEPTKHGFTEEDLLKCFEQIVQYPRVKIEGLMTMAPMTGDEKIIRTCFSRLRKLQEKLNEQLGNHQLHILSMGMSHDYKLAILEGATHLRIGSAIFN